MLLHEWKKQLQDELRGFPGKGLNLVEELRRLSERAN